MVSDHRACPLGEPMSQGPSPLVVHSAAWQPVVGACGGLKACPSGQPDRGLLGTDPC